MLKWRIIYPDGREEIVDEIPRFWFFIYPPGTQQVRITVDDDEVQPIMVEAHADDNRL